MIQPIDDANSMSWSLIYAKDKKLNVMRHDQRHDFFQSFAGTNIKGIIVLRQ